jgi:hypothetical protein
MASADFCTSLPALLSVGSRAAYAALQIYRSPRVIRVTFPLIPAAYTATRSVQVSDFGESRLLIPGHCLVCDFCSSGQWFALSFLQIPSHEGHPCLWLAVPLAGSAADLHRLVFQTPPCGLDQRQLRRYAPCLAHVRKDNFHRPVQIKINNGPRFVQYPL